MMRFFKRRFGLLIVAIILLSAVDPFLAFADDSARDLARYNAFKNGLMTLGVPPSDSVADYLTLELFYNTPYRSTVATDLQHIRIENFNFPNNEKTQGENLIRLSPRLKRANRKTLDKLQLRSIQISGHASKFVWATAIPNLYFIFKPAESQPSVVVSALLENANKNNPNLNLDYVPEQAFDADNIIRPFKTRLSNSQDHIYPLHGFLNSPLVDELAQKYGLTKFQFLNEKLIPHFADMTFDTAFRVGLWMQSHSQNLWIVVADDGRFHLAHKDLDHSTLDYFFHTEDPTNPKVLEEKNEFFKPIGDGHPVMQANMSSTNQDSRAAEPSFAFANYTLQSIIFNSRLSVRDQGILLKTFFTQFMFRVNHHFKLQIKFSEDTDAAFHVLDHLTSELDIRRLKIHPGKKLWTSGTGLYAFSEIAMREINNQISGQLLGPRIYPKNNQDQKSLKQLFKNNNGYYQITKQTQTELSEPEGLLKKLMVEMIGAYTSPITLAKFIYRVSTIHYEYTPQYILKVSQAGTIYSATPYANAKAQLASPKSSPEPATCSALFR